MGVSTELKKESAPPESDAVAFHLGYRRSLDGLRGIAILMVLLDHLQIVGGSFGFMGVQIFFVLSGFLITSLLTEEWGRTGNIKLGAFYLRRALRLLPALYVMLSVFLLYGVFFHSRAGFLRDCKKVPSVVFYYSNWRLTSFGPWILSPLAHTWSLSIEEQFYLIWPVLLLLMLKRCTRETALSLTALGVFLAWLTRFLMNAATAATMNRIMWASDTRADALLFGSALGVMLSVGLFPRWRSIGMILMYGSLFSVSGLIFMIHACNIYDESMVRFGWFIMCVFTGTIILQLMIAPGLLSRLVLENPAIVCVGKLSYGLYVWHAPILITLRDYFPPGWKWRAMVVLLSVLAAVFSYYLIERPFLRLKKRFQMVGQKPAYQMPVRMREGAIESLHK